MCYTRFFSVPRPVPRTVFSVTRPDPGQETGERTTFSDFLFHFYSALLIIFDMPRLHSRYFITNRGLMYDVPATLALVRARPSTRATSECIRTLTQMASSVYRPGFLLDLDDPESTWLVHVDQWFDAYGVSTVLSDDDSVVESVDDETLTVSAEVSEEEEEEEETDDDTAPVDLNAPENQAQADEIGEMFLAYQEDLRRAEEEYLEYLAHDNLFNPLLLEYVDRYMNWDAPLPGHRRLRSQEEVKTDRD